MDRISNPAVAGPIVDWRSAKVGRTSWEVREFMGKKKLKPVRRPALPGFKFAFIRG
ncbi:MAG: hypothetical protein ACYC4Q_11070 [Victivallaceae bacterium]